MVEWERLTAIVKDLNMSKEEAMAFFERARQERDEQHEREKNSRAKGVVVRDILERVAVGDDVSEFSDLSDSDEEEWTADNNAAPDDASDNDEPDFFCSSASSCSTSGRNSEKELLQVCHPDFFWTLSELDDLETPMLSFPKLLTTDMLGMLVQQTNLYSTLKPDQLENAFSCICSRVRSPLAHEAGHVHDIREYKEVNEGKLRGKCTPQTKLNATSYDVELDLDVTRNGGGGRCTCKAGVGGDCKHAAFAVDTEHTESCMSSSQSWEKKCTPKGKGSASEKTTSSCNCHTGDKMEQNNEPIEETPALTRYTEMMNFASHQELADKREPTSAAPHAYWSKYTQ
ncbi:hypothetical protein HPB50_011964 [Hyalomma asiaticum]|uniref:Uncharacterized protein n=1 Tax=Hyalomma asiaticum TaxID=266040 RepID=A0ACB7SPV2_HYAAI|nr:hypothetical protein HPB50_011964 [Hyalomma asiaticum]